MNVFQAKQNELDNILPGKITGKVRRISGLVVETSGMAIPVGSQCKIISKITGYNIESEVVGFREGITQLMPLGEMRGVAPGDDVVCVSTSQTVSVGHQLLGRVLNGFGVPIDGGPPIVATATRPIHNQPPDPIMRPRIDLIIPTGVRAIDAFLTIGKGQRVGIFSGTGVGKSTLLGMLARMMDTETTVISLVGERGREVRDFIERDLGPEGMKKSVLVVATSDQPAPVRVRAPFVATAIAEYFRDLGQDVTLLMDSVTRMAMAQRDIGNSIGEVAGTKGYPPSVFALLPRLMERAGRSNVGSITALYTVLVEGDDMNEPISDAVRGILDGHFILTRRLADRGHFPAIDVLSSISRLQSEIVPKPDLMATRRLRQMLTIYNENEDMINLGQFPVGANPEIDQARAINQPLKLFLQQDMYEKSDANTLWQSVKELAERSLQPVKPIQQIMQQPRQNQGRRGQ